MKKYYIAIISILMSYSFINATLTNNGNLNENENKKWNYIEYTFLTKPKKQEGILKDNTLKLMLSGTAGIGGFVLTKLLYNRYNYNYGIDANNLIDIDNNQPTKSLISSTAGILTSLISYKFLNIYNHISQRNIEYSNLLKFIDNFAQHKEHIPMELNKLFTNILDNYSRDTNYIKNNYEDILELIKDNIYLHFPKKYLADENNSLSLSDFFNKKSFTGQVKFDLSTGKTLDGIANLIRAIK